ncbi:MAG: hypothetical protein AAFX03_12290 [Pseudomonadota bacterium]
MKLPAALGACAAALATSACVISVDADDRDVRADYVSPGSSWGTVYAADLGAEAVTITVSDNGCTTRDFFDARVFPRGDDAFEIGFTRIRQDYCKALNPDGVAISWSFAELGIPPGARVTVLNNIRR